MRVAQNNLGIASLIVGLAGLVSFKLFIVLCVPLCVGGIVLAVMARRESSIVFPILGITFSLMGLAAMTVMVVIAGMSIDSVNSMQLY